MHFITPLAPPPSDVHIVKTICSVSNQLLRKEVLYPKLEALLKHLEQKCIEKAIRFEGMEVIGGFARWFIANHPELFHTLPPLGAEYSIYPPDVDIRFHTPQASYDDLLQFVDDVVAFVGVDAIHKRCQPISDGKLFYSMVSFGKNPHGARIELLFISSLKHEKLFEHEVKLPLSFEDQEFQFTDTEGYEALYSKTLIAKTPWEINHRGWARLVSYECQGYRVQDERTAAIFQQQAFPHGIDVETILERITHCVANHHPDDPIAQIAIGYQACCRLRGQIPESDLQQVWEELRSKNEMAPKKSLISDSFFSQICDSMFQISPAFGYSCMLLGFQNNPTKKNLRRLLFHFPTVYSEHDTRAEAFTRLERFALGSACSEVLKQENLFFFLRSATSCALWIAALIKSRDDDVATVAHLLWEKFAPHFDSPTKATVLKVLFDERVKTPYAFFEAFHLYKQMRGLLDQEALERAFLKVVHATCCQRRPIQEELYDIAEEQLSHPPVFLDGYTALIVQTHENPRAKKLLSLLLSYNTLDTASVQSLFPYAPELVTPYLARPLFDREATKETVSQVLFVADAIPHFVAYAKERRLTNALVWEGLICATKEPATLEQACFCMCSVIGPLSASILEEVTPRIPITLAFFRLVDQYVPEYFNRAHMSRFQALCKVAQDPPLVYRACTVATQFAKAEDETVISALKSMPLDRCELGTLLGSLRCSRKPFVLFKKELIVSYLAKSYPLPEHKALQSTMDEILTLAVQIQGLTDSVVILLIKGIPQGTLRYLLVLFEKMSSAPAHDFVREKLREILTGIFISKRVSLKEKVALLYSFVFYNQHFCKNYPSYYLPLINDLIEYVGGASDDQFVEVEFYITVVGENSAVIAFDPSSPLLESSVQKSAVCKRLINRLIDGGSPIKTWKILNTALQKKLIVSQEFVDFAERIIKIKRGSFPIAYLKEVLHIVITLFYNKEISSYLLLGKIMDLLLAALVTSDDLELCNTCLLSYIQFSEAAHNFKYFDGYFKRAKRAALVANNLAGVWTNRQIINFVHMLFFAHAPDSDTETRNACIVEWSQALMAKKPKEWKEIVELFCQQVKHKTELDKDAALKMSIKSIEKYLHPA